MEKLYDCIVVGAGPSGGSAAYFLAKAGYKILLLERKKLPRYKPCGGGIPSIVSTYLDFPLFEEKDTTFLKDIIYSYRGTKNHAVTLNDYIMFGVSRAVFDHKIVQAACKHGTDLIQNELVNKIKEEKEKVSVFTKKGNIYQAKFLLACDGENSIIAQQLGLRKKTKPNAVSMVVEVPIASYPPQWRKNLSSNLTGHLDMNWIENGYVGLIPKKNGCSIGIYAFKKTDIEKLKHSLDNFGQYLGLNVSNFQHHTRFMYVWDKNFKLNTKRCLLLGDSARLIDPLSGEGIKYAIKSAIIAREIIKGAFEKNYSLDKYTKLVHEKICSELKLAKKMAFWSYNFPKTAYDGLIRVSEDTAKILNGEVSYSEFIRRLKRKILKTILKKIGIKFYS